MRHTLLYKTGVVLGTLLTAPCLAGLFMVSLEGNASQFLLGFFGVGMYLVGTLSQSPVAVLLLLYLPPLVALVCFWRVPTTPRAWLLWALYNLYTLLPSALVFAAICADDVQILNDIACFCLSVLHL